MIKSYSIYIYIYIYCTKTWTKTFVIFSEYLGAQTAQSTVKNECSIYVHYHRLNVQIKAVFTSQFYTFVCATEFSDREKQT